MSYVVKVYARSVQNMLIKLGFQVGYSATGAGSLNEYLNTFYFKDSVVVNIVSSTLFIEKIVFCNKPDTLLTYDKTLGRFKEELKQMLKSATKNIPSILNTFDDIIFHSFDDPDKKLNQLRAASQQFHPDFLSIFKSEMDAMQQSTEVQASFNIYDTLSDGARTFYVSGVAANSLSLREVQDTGLGYRNVSIGEIANGSTWKVIESGDIKCQLRRQFEDVCGCIGFLLNSEGLLSITGVNVPSTLDDLTNTPRSKYTYATDGVMCSWVNVSSDTSICCHGDSWHFGKYYSGGYGEKLKTTSHQGVIKLLISYITRYCRNDVDKQRRILESAAALGCDLIEHFELCLYEDGTLDKLVEWTNQVYELSQNVNSRKAIEGE